MKNNLNIFFTSDTHFGHNNIIKYCKRPFLKDPALGFDEHSNRDVEAMDEALIRNWNSVVSPQDTVYHLGDFAFYKDQKQTRDVIRRLNGIKILVRGNHDEYLEPETLNMFNGVYPYLEVRAEAPKHKSPLIVLLHYGMRVWNQSHRGSWHLYGHSHGSLPDDPHSLSFDVGVDCHNFTPVSYDIVQAIMSKKFPQQQI